MRRGSGEVKMTSVREECAYSYLAPVHGPLNDGSYQIYLVHVQETGVETDLCPTSYAETSKSIEIQESSLPLPPFALGVGDLNRRRGREVERRCRRSVTESSSEDDDKSDESEPVSDSESMSDESKSESEEDEESASSMACRCSIINLGAF